MRAIALGLLLAALGAAADAPVAPDLVSIFPLGGARGSVVEATVRAKNLSGDVRIWSPSAGLSAETLSFEPAEGKSDPGRLRVLLRLGDALAAGPHDVRLIGPGGLSNALSVYVHDEAAVVEQNEPHDLARQAQPLAAWPAVVHGRIAEVGEVDFYSFRVAAGEELLFRTLSSDPLDPGVSIYRLTGSWFDPDRPTRLAFHDEPVEYPDEPVEAVLRYRFEEAGEYLVRVNGFWGYGGDDHVYALFVDRAPEGPVEWPPKPPGPLWSERDWRRALSPDRLARLAERTAGASAQVEIPVVEAGTETLAIPTPALLVGAIDRPGKIARFRFSAAEGDKLVFEIEAPEKSLPEFNPVLRIFDADGVEAFTNIWSRVNANGNISKQIYPKTQYAFPRAGDFTLEIRDATATYGDAAMRYRLLVRPWLPHLGAARIAEDRLNLVAGQPRKLTVSLDQEEGYDGLGVFSIDGLPEGVVAAMGADVDPPPPPAFNEGKKERFTTLNQKATFALLVAEDAPPTPEPVVARVHVRPAAGGRLGEKILVKELLLTVVPRGKAREDSPRATDER